MPIKPKNSCSYPGCPELTSGQYCDKHHKQLTREYNQRRGSSAKQGYGAHWRKIRLMVLKEEPLCRECMRQGRITPASQVDHIDGNVANLARDNLQPLCPSCHSRKTARENGRWG